MDPVALTCSRCGMTLTPDAPQGLCPKCLLAVAVRGDDSIGLETAAASSALNAALAQDPGPARSDEAAGTRIGRYKLLQKIGEGGMGVVYMAEQERPVVRRVAIKIIKQGMDTRQVIARFEAERQALALMDHPNIARVFDAGATDTGRPYFVMELVRGVSITEYCDTNNLTTCQRLELFLPVCRAVQHAHQKGIIHRDIKPSNVLITLHDGVPVPKVIDFGIAKATSGRLTDKTLFTEYHHFVGTPQYMSPEQAEMSGLDIDTRADVYALGVLLYELLTGTTPFDETALRKAAYAEIQRMIREVEPPRPSTRISTLGETLTKVAAHRATDPRRLSTLMRGDLDWIVMKCLEKDRTRRYETANAIGMDVLRYLKDEPVEASPPTATYRLWKFARKYKNQVAALVVIVTLLVLGVMGTSIGMIRSHFALGRAQTAETLATERKTAAEKALEAATIARRQAERDAARADVVNSFLQALLTSAQPGPLDRAADVRVADSLDGAEVIIDAKLNNQPEAEAQVRHTIGLTYSSLGLTDYAEKQLRRAYAAAVKTEGEDSIAALTIARDWIFVLEKRNPDEAQALARKNHAIATQKFGREHTMTLQAAKVFASALQRKVECANLLQEIIRHAREQGDSNEKLTEMYYKYATALLPQLPERPLSMDELSRLLDERPRIGQTEFLADYIPGWFLEWNNLLLLLGVGPPREWSSSFWRGNVWSALNEHLLEHPEAADRATDGVAFDEIKYRVERWDPPIGTPPGQPSLVVLHEGTFQQLKRLDDPSPGIYRLSLDVPRPMARVTQHTEAWLYFGQWEVDFHTSPTSDYQAMLRTAPVEHRRMKSLILPNDPTASHGPGGRKDQYALAASSSVTLPAGRYRFSLNSDDGARFYLDGRLIIDAWVTRYAERDDAVVELSGGAHQLKVEYFQEDGAAALWLQIAPTSSALTADLPVKGAGKFSARQRRQIMADLEYRLRAEIQFRPFAAEPLFNRAVFYARRGRFAQASQDYISALRFDGSDHIRWCESAFVAAQAGNMAEYRRHCAQMLSRFGASTNKTTCERIVKVCTFTPNGVPDLGLVMQLAERAVAPGDSDDPQLVAWRALAMGMAQYRSGDFDAAATWLNKVADNLADPGGNAVTKLFQAMADFRRGRPAEAQVALKLGSEIIERQGPKDGSFDWRFGEWIIALHAQKEAADLLGHAVPDPPAK